MSIDAPLGGLVARGLGDARRIKWPLVRSSEIFELRYGKALVEGQRRPGSVPVFGTNGRTGSHDMALFSGPGVVLGRKGAGHLGVHWSSCDFWVIDTAYSLAVAENIDLRFAYYLIGHVGLDHLKHGTSNPSLTRDAFAAQYFPVPPLADQLEIAAILGALDDKIESNRRAVVLARDLAIARLTAAVTEAEAVALGHVAEVRKGLSYKGDGLVAEGDGIPLVNMGNAANFGWLKRQGFKHYSGAFKPRHVAPAGSLIVTGVDLTWKNAVIGWPLLVPPDVGDVLFTHHMLLIDFEPANSWMKLPLWAHLYSPAARANIEALVYGTTVATLPLSGLAGLTFPIPAADDPAISAAEALLERAWSYEVESARLAGLRDALLPGLLTGQIRARGVGA